MKTGFRKSGIAIGVLALFFLVAGILLSRDTTLQRLQETDRIRVGYAVEAPYAFLKPGGEVTGEAPEIAKRMVANLGIQNILWRQVEFSALIDELEAQRIDVIAAGMYITPERAQRVCFSVPTFHVLQGLLVPKDNPRQIHAYQQALSDPDIKIAVIAGAVEEGLLQRIGLKREQLVVVPDALTGRVAVESGLCDGLALSTPTIQWMARRNQLGNTSMAQPFEQSEQALKERLGYGAFAFHPQATRLVAAWNSALTNFIGTSDHQKLVAEFGFTPAELPGDVTVAEIISE